MTNKEIAQALREECKTCSERLVCKNGTNLVGFYCGNKDAADLIERLTARGEMMKGTSNFDKLCHQVYNADGNGRDYIGKATGATCRLCKSPLYAYYCEERLYLVECKTCEMKALVKAENPQVAAYRAFESEVK